MVDLDFPGCRVRPVKKAIQDFLAFLDSKDGPVHQASQALQASLDSLEEM